MKCSSKIVVFDLDETLGYFMELGMFWDALKSYIEYANINIPINQELFNNILDLYPEFLRPNIIGILTYLKKKKEQNHCNKLMIYTNNQGPKEWAIYIMKYFEQKIRAKVFDQIISAFKVQGKRVELCRTTNMKTHADLIKCTKLPKDTEICFLDDVYYPDMIDNKIYYINAKPYIHDLDFNEMITRFLNTNNIVNNPKEFREFIISFMNKYHYIYIEKKQESQNIDNIISKKILQNLHEFFKIKNIGPNIGPHTNKTKNNRILKNKTLKRLH